MAIAPLLSAIVISSLIDQVTHYSSQHDERKLGEDRKSGVGMYPRDDRLVYKE